MRTTTTKLLRSVWMLCFVCLAWVASAQYNILNTGFEGGLPEGWVVENGVGSAVWTHDAVDTGNELPAKAYEGTADMLFFVDGVSTMASSKLLTPKLDLTIFNTMGVGEPLLTFWYANTGRILEEQSFVDTLRIYGRALETEPWTLLKTIDESHDLWTKDTVELKSYALSTSFQICFEAANGNGRGVMIDEVKVIATAFCGAMPNIRITEKTETSAKVSWDGSQDVLSTELKVSTTPLTDMTQKGDVYDGTLYVREHSLTGLTLQQDYYVYVRNYCNYEDYSPWGYTAFRPDMAVNVPYEMDFEDYPGTVNNEYTDKPNVDTLNLPTNWTYWKNENLLKTFNNAHQYYPYRGWAKTESYNPSGVAEENCFLNIKGYNNTSYGMIESYVILPRFNVDSIQKVQISFDYKTPSYSYAKLRIGVVDDPAEEGSFTLVDEITSLKLGAETNKWTSVTVSFANYKGHGKYIAIQQEAVKYQNKSGGTSAQCQIDNVKVDYMPACVKTTALQVTNLTNTSAQITWAGNAEAYDVKVASTPLEDMTETADIFDGTLNTNVKELTGLKPGSSYKWYVKPTCGTEWSEWRINTLVNEKDTMEIPYKQDFNNYFYGSSSNLPNGWTFTGGYSTSPYLNVTNYSEPASMYVGGSTSAYSYAVTPCLKAPLNKLQATFMCYAGNVAYKMQVGIMTDPEDEATFVPMDTVEFEAKNIWQEVTVEFDKYTGDGCYIAFKVGELTAGPVYVDDLVVSKIPTCKMVDVLELTDFTSNSVQVNWTPRGEETEWTLCYGPAGFDVNTAGTTVTATDKPSYKITGLEEATEYDIYVRAECGEEGFGAWRMETALTQNAPAKLNGYKHDFSSDKENAKWVFVNGENENQWVVGKNCTMELGNPAAYVSNNPETQDFVYSPISGNKNVWMYRTFEALPGAYAFKFNWKGQGGSNSHAVRAFLVPADVVLEPNTFYNMYGTIYSTVPEGWINLATNRTTSSENQYVNQDSVWSSGWNQSKVDFVIKEEGLYNIAFMWLDNSTLGSTCPVAVDNIAIDTALCPVPQDVTLDLNYIPATKAKLMWTGGTKAEVKVMVKDLTSISKRELLNNVQSLDTIIAWGKDLTSCEFLAEGLEVGTKYYYGIRTYNETDTSDWAVGNFTTILAVDAPYSDNFNDDKASVTLPWKKIGATASQVTAPTMEELFEGAAKGTGTAGWTKTKYGNTTYGNCENFAGNGFLRTLATTKIGSKGGIRYYVYSPAFIAGNAYQLRFDVVYTNNKTNGDICAVDITEAVDSTDLFAVLVSTDMGETWNMKDAHVWTLNQEAYKDKGFKSVNSILDIVNKGDGVFFNQNISLADYEGDSLQIAFYAFSAREATGTTLYCNVDNFYVGPKPCEQPKDLTVSEVTQNTVKLDWTPGETETAWRIKVASRYLDDMQSMENVVLDTVVKNQPSVVLNKLAAGRPYAIYMQSICDANNVESGASLWLDPMDVTTLCDTVYTLPYVENFDNYSLGTEHRSTKACFLPCWETMANTANNATSAYIYTSTSSSLPNKSSDHTQEKDYGSSLYINTPSNGWIATALPEMPKRVDSLMVTFYVTSTTINSELEVGISYQQEFTPIKTISIKQYEWLKVVVPFDAYTGTELIEVDEEGNLDTTIVWGNKITFLTKHEDVRPMVYIDDLTVDVISGCLPPSSFVADSVTHDAIHYKWSTRDYETSYRLKVFDTEVPDSLLSTQTAMVDSVMKTNNFLLTNLPADRPFYAYIAPTCEGGEEAWGSVLTVRTACPEAYSLPYRENFNTWVYGQASDCWTMLSNHSTPQAYASESYILDGQYLEASCNTSGSGGRQWQYYALPKLDARLDTVQLSLMMNSSSQDAVGATVGVMTDPTDTTTFVPVAELKPVYQTWTSTTILFNEYVGEGKYIAFRQYYGTYMKYDNIEVSSIGCVPPANGEILKPTHSSLDIKWNIQYPTPTYDVLYFSDLNDSVIVTVENKEKTTITGLRPNTNYQVFVRSICEDKGPSLWVKIGERATTAVPVELPYVEDFSVAEQNAQWNFVQTNDYCNECNQWTFGTAAKTTDTCLYISNNGADFDYAKDRSGAYVYRPVNFKAGRHQMILDWTSETSYSSSYSTPTDKYDYMRIFLIPTTVEMKEITEAGGSNGYYSTSLPDFAAAEISAKAMRDQKTWTMDTLSFRVPQDGVYYVAFYWNNYNSIREGEKPAAVDNLKVEEVTFAQPEDVTAYALVSGTEIELDWLNGKEWDLKVSSTPIIAENLANAEYVGDIYDGKVTNKPYVVDGMKPNTEYYCAVRTRSENNVTAWTLDTIQTLYSPYTLPFVETFKAYGTYQTVLDLPDWKFYKGFLEDAFEGVALKEPAYVSSTEWKYLSSGCSFTESHATAVVRTYQYVEYHGESNIVSGTTADWMVTPNIAIPEGQSQLTFDLALTDGKRVSSSSSVVEDLCTEVTEMVEDDKFVVAISTDNGRTWKEDNTTIWNDVDGDYSYSEIPVDGQKYLIDLNKYAGQIIQVAFMVESSVINEYRFIHLDNVRISQTISVAISDTTCAGYAYRENGFDIPAMEVMPQAEPYTYTRMVTNDLTADTLYTLSLMVGQASADTIKANICQGEVYEQFGFKANETGRYVNMATSVLGCDSVVVLDLVVNPSYNFEENLTICRSQLPYNWRGQTLEDAGQHTDEYNTITGCDSIYTVNLSVVDNYEQTLDVQMCEGETYILGSQVITKTGTYAEPFKSVEGCDSTVTVNVTVNPVYNQTVEVSICQGSSYEIDGQTYTKPGLYPVFYSSVTGCDSIVTYNLKVLEKFFTMLNDTITEGETYNENGFTDLTEEGIYTDTLQAVGGCDSIVVLTLIVEPVVAIDEAYATTITLTPNPVKKGGTVTVQQDFNADKVKVEVFSPIGAKVKEQYVDLKLTKQIQLTGFNVSGAYLIRITTDEGDVYRTKLIVQ